MRKLIIALIMLQSLIAQDIKVQTGMLSYLSTSPYKNISYDYFLVPLISVEYKNFYISGTEAGYIFFSSKDLYISFELSPTLIGYQSDDSDFLQGMKDRDTALESGIKLEYIYDFHKLKIKAVYDFFDVYGSYSALFEYSYLNIVDDKNIYITNFGLEHFSAKKSSYYFGVLNSESTLNRESYSLNETYNFYASVDYIYMINADWTFFANLEYKYYNYQVYKSPVVDKQSAVSNFLGVLYEW